jgi:hypothetical protein
MNKLYLLPLFIFIANCDRCCPPPKPCPNQVSFVAYKDADVAIPAHTATKVEHLVEGWDLSNNYDITPAGFVAPEDGHYYFVACDILHEVVYNKTVTLMLYKNDTYLMDLFSGMTTVTTDVNACGQTDVWLTKDDLVQVYIQHDQNQPRLLPGGFFAGRKID